jgi:hypothetical protein
VEPPVLGPEGGLVAGVVALLGAIAAFFKAFTVYEERRFAKVEEAIVKSNEENRLARAEYLADQHDMRAEHRADNKRTADLLFETQKSYQAELRGIVENNVVVMRDVTLAVNEVRVAVGNLEKIVAEMQSEGKKRRAGP